MLRNRFLFPAQPLKKRQIPTATPSAAAILDRFLHHAVIVAMTGRSYRLKNAPASEALPEKPCKKSKEKV